MIHRLGGLVAGLAIAVITIMIVEALGHRLFPPPGGPDTYATASGQAPIATLLSVLAAWFLGTLFGSWLSVRISRHAWTGWVIAAVILLAAIFNFTTMRHPMWMMIAGVLAPPLAAWIAIRLSKREGPRGAASA